MAAVARRGLRRRRARPPSRVRDARGPGPAGPRARARPHRRQPAVADALLRADESPARRCWCAGPATPARTASSCCSRPDDAPAAWDAILAGRRRPRSVSARATRSASRPAFTCTATTERGPQPDRGGPRLVLQGGDRLHRRRGRRGGPRRRHRREARPVHDRGPGIARPGNPVVGGGEVTSGTFSPCLERGIGMAYVSARACAPGTRSRSTCGAQVRPAVVERSRSTERKRE